MFVILASLLGVSSCGRKEDPKPATEAARSGYYTCSMHPYINSPSPGTCPVCGMALVWKETGGESGGGTATLGSVRFSSAQRAMANVRTAKAERGQIKSTIDVNGVVEVAEDRKSVVTARVRGRIEHLNTKVTGAVVNAGEPLMDLYSPDLVAGAQELLLAADARTGGTMGSGLLDAARSKLRSHYGLSARQIAAIESTRTVPQSVQIFAPRSGTITMRNAIEGSYVNEGDVLFEFADLRTVWCWFDIHEADAAVVNVGQVIAVQAGAGSREFSGRISFIDPMVNPTTRTVRVRAEVSNASGLLRPQMFVTGRIAQVRRPTLVVPLSAVIRTGTRSLVWVEIEENVFEPRDVSVGAVNGDRIEILSGLAEGDAVAVNGAFLIDSESRLTSPDKAQGGEHTGHQGSHQ